MSAGHRTPHAHPAQRAADLWKALLAVPRDEWHRPDLPSAQSLKYLHIWEKRGWLEMRHAYTTAPYEVRLTVNGRVWVRQWLGDDA